jgi:hypothetical protein
MTTLALLLPAPDLPSTTKRASAASIGSVTPSAIVSSQGSAITIPRSARGRLGFCGLTAAQRARARAYLKYLDKYLKYLDKYLDNYTSTNAAKLSSTCIAIRPNKCIGKV